MSSERGAGGASGTDRIVIERSYRARLDEVWDLWTTREGFESWWGPQGFRVEVHEIDPRDEGALAYDMIAEAPEMIAAMKQMGQPVSHPTRARFREVRPRHHLVITSVIDFIAGVTPYENDIIVDLSEAGDRVRMVVTLAGLHTPQFTEMQRQGFTSQLTKLDPRFG